VEVVIKPLDDTRLIIERAPRLSGLFGFLGEIEATKITTRREKKGD